MIKIKTFWRAETGIFLGIWLVLMVAGRSRLFSDPGPFWHIAVGQRILSSGHLIHTDPFSFTYMGKRWLAHGWLFDCSMAFVNKWGDLDSILLITTTILACLYTWVAYRLIQMGIHWLVAILIMSLAMGASAYHFHPRPHLITIAFLGITFARLCDFEAGRISLKRLFWLIPLYVLWTNIHGGMVGGVATIGMTVMGWSFTKLIGKDTPIQQFQQIIPLSGLVIACALTSLVNPFGTELPRLWYSLLRSPVLPRLMIEHAPLYSRPTDMISLTVLLFGFLYLLALAGTFPKWPRITWLIPLVWLYLTFMRIRNGPLFAITAVIALADMFPHIRWIKWLTQHGSELLRVRVSYPARKNRLNWRPALIPILLVLVTVILQISSIQVPVIGHGWAKLHSHFPVELLSELRKYEQDHPDGTPIFNEMLFGGFIICYTPGLRVFIDDRCELYGDKWLLSYAHAIEQDPSQVARWAREYGFEIALTELNSAFDKYLESARGWTLVQRSRAATLYRKRSRSEKNPGY
jgi:hypothetical protein